MGIFQVLALEFFPLPGQPVAINDAPQLLTIHRILIDELQNSVVISGPAGSQSDGD
jgi:hypothetical protein